MGGFGALYNTDWCVGFFKNKFHVRSLSHHLAFAADCCSDEHINIKEMWAVVAAVDRWSNLWKNKNVVFITDNNTVRSALESGKSKNNLIMTWLKKIFWRSITYNFNISAVRIKSDDNIICDSLSRWGCPNQLGRIGEVDKGDLLCCSHLFKC